MNESDYINYLNQNIDKSSIAGKELIVKKEFADKVKQEFSTAKVKEDEFVTSGFIIEENGIIDYVPIVGGQNPSENYKLISYNPNTGMVVVKPVYAGYDSEIEEIKLQVKQVNGKWIIDDYVQKY